MRMNKAELLSALRLAAKYLPPATATLMNEAATRLDVTSSALSEALAQRDAVTEEHAAAMNTITALMEILGTSDSLSISGQVAALKAERDALAAENARLKAAKEIIRHLNVNREEANFCGIDDCHIDDAIEAMITPATDRFSRELKAQQTGIISAALLEKSAEYEAKAKEADGFATDNRYRFAAAMFRGFAQQLRGEKAE